jgi:hypothetical protein
MTRTLKIFGLFLSLITVQIAIGQTTFNYQNDFNNILEKTKDPKDNLFYDNLLKRFSVNDTTMTSHEVLALLIGFTAKPEYKPYSDFNIEREIYRLNDENKYQEGLDAGLKFIKTNPFSIKALVEITYSYYKLGKEDSARYYRDRGKRIFQAMYYSGNGKETETPTFALGPTDGQDYVHKFIGAEIGTMGSGQDKNGNFLDKIEAKFEDGQTVMLYFIIQHATAKMFSEENLKSPDKKDKKKRKKK